MNTDLLNRLLAANKGRQLSLLPLKFTAMRESCFRFFRGTSALFYEEFLAAPVEGDTTNAWICGDLHPENFGFYKGDNGLVYFDVNDFDEAVLAPVTWELSRFITSLFICGPDWKLTSKQTDKIISIFIDQYCQCLSAGKAFAAEENIASPLIRTFFKKINKRTEKKVLKERVQTKRIITGNGKAIPAADEEKQQVNEWMKDYFASQERKIKVHDVAIRIAGTGSLGLKRYIIFAGYKKPEPGYVLLDLKQARASCLNKKTETDQPAWKNEAQRITAVQQMSQYDTPRYLDVISVSNTSYVLRELQPQADRINMLTINKKVHNIPQVIREMASAAAWGHLRCAGRKGASGVEELMAFSKKNTWKDSLRDTAERLAGIMQGYYADYTALYDSGVFGDAVLERK